MGPNEPDEILRGAFGDLFEGESTLPPEAVWQNVRAAVVVTEKKRRGLFFWLIPAVVLLGSGVALVLLLNGGEKTGDESRSKQENGVRDERIAQHEQNTAPTSVHAPFMAPQDQQSHIPARSSGTSFFGTRGTYTNTSVGTGTGRDLSTFAPTTRGITIGVTVPDLSAVPESEEETEQALSTRPLLPWLSPEAITERHFDVPQPDYSFPRWVVGVEVGLGTNQRAITGNYSETYNSNQLVTSNISLTNRCVAVTGGFRFNRFVSIHTGISTGVNTYRSPWYLRMLTAQDGGSYTFQTSEGSVKMASEDVNGYFSESDTALFRMRLHHSSRYYSIPLSVKLTLPGTKLSGYVRFGGSYDLHADGQTKASLKYSNLKYTNSLSGWNGDAQTVSLESTERTKLRSFQALIGFGVETHRDSPLQFFVEPQMSIPLTPVYNNGGLRVTSQYMQLRAGMTFYFPSHPTKSSIRTSW